MYKVRNAITAIFLTSQVSDARLHICGIVLDYYIVSNNYSVRNNFILCNFNGECGKQQTNKKQVRRYLAIFGNNESILIQIHCQILPARW